MKLPFMLNMKNEPNIYISYSAYRKLHPPSPVDDVWRLERIRKDGPYHKKLLEHGIRTVEDFLKCLVIDSSGLQNVGHLLIPPLCMT